MIKKIMLFVTVAWFIFAIIISCEAVYTEVEDKTKPDLIEETLDQKLARIVAENRVEEVKLESENWNETSIVTKSYPIFTPGIEGVAYYEFKVETNGGDSGYILVGVTETDVEIPEMTTSGLTITEQYRALTKRDDIDIIRYDWFDSAAQIHSENKFDSIPEVAAIMTQSGSLNVGTSGVDKDTLAYDYFKQNLEISNTIKNTGAQPYLSKVALDNYYAEKEKEASITNSEVEVLNISDLAVKAGRKISWPTKKTKTYKLDNRFDNGWRTPAWSQPAVTGNVHGQLVGCGPLSWGMVFAYWSAFRGKTELFDGEDLKYKYLNGYVYPKYSTKIFNALIDLRADTKSWDAGKNQTGTWPIDMKGGLDYVKRKGYTGSTFKHKNAWNYEEIINEIESNRPVVLLIGATSSSWIGADHYVVIEEVFKRYWSNTGAVIDLAYKANYGWSDTRKWIYLINWTDWGGKLKPMYDAYFINIK